MTRTEQHNERILTADPDTLGTADFIERRSLMQARRRVDVTDELRRLGPVDMTRRHRRNHLHPKARNTNPSKYLTQQAIIGAALSTGFVARMEGSRVIERTV